MLRIFYTREKNLTTACYANVCSFVRTSTPSRLDGHRFVVDLSSRWRLASDKAVSGVLIGKLLAVRAFTLLTLWIFANRAFVSMFNEKKKFINVYSVNYAALGGRSSRGLFQLRLNNECRNFTSPDSPFCRCFHRETASFLPLLRNVWNVRSVVTSREVISKVKWGKVCDVFVLGYRDAATYCVPKDSWPV